MKDALRVAIELTDRKVDELSRYRGAPALTIYMPLQTPTAKASGKQENMIRFKNLIRRGEGCIESYRGEQQQQLGTMREMLGALSSSIEGGERLWDPQAAAIAIFLAPEQVDVVPLSVDVEEEVLIGERFHLKPLFSDRSSSEPYFLLALDLHDVRLYRGNRRNLEEVPLTPAPRPLPEILEGFDFERSLNKAPGGSTVYVGHQGGEENLTPHIIEFLQEVDRCLRQTIGEGDSPVLLAGTENVVGHFRHHSSVARLHENHLKGSPRSFTVEELHRRSRDMVRQAAQARVDREIEAVEEYLDSRQGARELEEICSAAFEGRLQLLLVASDTAVHGLFDETSERLELDERGEDLLDLAAGHAWSRGTRVYAVPRSRIPRGLPAAGLVHATA
ncbi:MAG: hypothetical protein ACOC28_03100 [Alkalispirochaetaceae bacterium]